MQILLCPDSFKDSLNALAVANYMENGIRQAKPDAQITKIPLSDGGEGFLEALLKPLESRLVKVQTKDPLLRNIEASYGIVHHGRTAVIEMARASGLELLKPEERDPMRTSTIGTGLLIKDALDKGCSQIIIGLGGSATNDGGMGLAKALGVKFLDVDDQPIGDGCCAIKDLHHIDLSGLDKRLDRCEIIAACDVSNPLTGPEGASLVFGQQKGGKPEELNIMDNHLKHFASKVNVVTGKELSKQTGAGAAGGTGFGLSSFLNAELKSGIELIMDKLQFESHLKKADWIFTGEGQIDAQTLNGKVLTGVAKLAKKHQKPVVAIAGVVDSEIRDIYDLGISAVFSIINKPLSLDESLKLTGTSIENCMSNLMKVILKL